MAKCTEELWRACGYGKTRKGRGIPLIQLCGEVHEVTTNINGPSSRREVARIIGNVLETAAL